VLGEPIALAPGSACTESYFIAGAFDGENETANYAHYLASKFARFLVLQRKATQDITADRFRFVPRVDLSRRWSDAELYDKFKLTPDEIARSTFLSTPRSPRVICLGDGNIAQATRRRILMTPSRKQSDELHLRLLARR
jgi:site-specific DNA-methyltransferase (adenine-specific)